MLEPRAGWAILCALAAAACVSAPSAAPPGAALSRPWSKIAPALIAQWNDRSGGPLEILLRTVGPLTGSQRDRLTAVGFVLRSSSADVASGRIARRALRSLAELPFVLRIEPAQPLSPQRGRSR